MDRPPRVFISYSHDSDDHADQVLALADRLRAEGIDATLDQYETSPLEGWPSWMERQVRESDFVLMVCTEIYLRRAERREEPGAGHGVTFESTLSLQHLYDAGARNTRFIPVVFDDRDTTPIPTPLRGASRYNISTENGYEKLYRHLTGQAETPAPDLGQRRRLPRRERQRCSPPQVAEPELRSPKIRKEAPAKSSEDWSAKIVFSKSGHVTIYLKTESEHILEWKMGLFAVNVILDGKVVSSKVVSFRTDHRMFIINDQSSIYDAELIIRGFNPYDVTLIVAGRLLLKTS